MKRVLSLFCISSLLFIANAAKAANGVYVDGVRVIEIQPNVLIEGEEQEVTVKLAYELVSHDNGIIYLGFNLPSPESFQLVAEQNVTRGEGTVILKAKIIPKYWGKLKFFEAFGNLSEFPHPKSWSPLSTDHMPVEIKRQS